MKEKLRVLHAPVNVGNQPWVLSRHERALGVRSDLVVNYSTWLQYPADRCLGQWLDSSWATRARRLCFALSAPWRYDVFHYYFGQSLFHWGSRAEPSRRWFADLRLAKRRRAARADDPARLRRPSQPALRGAKRNHHVPSRPVRIRRRLPLRPRPRRSESSSTASCRWRSGCSCSIRSWPTTFPGRSFSPTPASTLRRSRPRGRGPRARLRSSMPRAIRQKRARASFARPSQRLQRRHEIRYVEVTRLPHAEAMKLYAQADLVIDQLLAGWYGGFAVETMAMGKPVVCYIRGGPAIRAAGDGRRVAVDSRASRLAGGRPGGGDRAAVGMARLGPPRTGVRPPLAPSAADRRSDDRHLSRSARAALLAPAGRRWLCQCCLCIGNTGGASATQPLRLESDVADLVPSPSGRGLG